MTKMIVTFLGIGTNPGFPLWALIVTGLGMLFLGLLASGLCAAAAKKVSR